MNSRRPGFLCTLILLASAATGCAGGDAGAAASPPSGPPPAVEAVRATEGSLPLVERLSGVARAANQVQLRPEMSGIVDRVLVQSGDAVKVGQQLVRLRDDTERERLEQAIAETSLVEASVLEADARVAELRARVVRARSLAQQELIGALELETLEAQLQGAEANAAQTRARVEQSEATVAERRTALARTVIRAPIEGRVGRRNVEVGMRVDPSTLLFVIGTLDRLIVDVSLTEEMLNYVREGQTVRLNTRAAGAEPFEARISRISPFLAEESFSTTAEIDVDNRDGRLRPGMFVTVDVSHGESERATLVPTGALWEDPRSGDWFAFVVRPEPGDASLELEEEVLSAETHPVERRLVTILAEGRGIVGIGAVLPGEWVVTVGQHLLAEQETPAGRVRATTWERVERLQSLQREDLLEGFMAKQRRVASERGAMPPTNAEYVGDAAPR